MATTKKVALVTGAGSGIGRHIALALLRNGYSVVLAGRRVAALEETIAAASNSASSWRRAVVAVICAVVR